MKEKGPFYDSRGVSCESKCVNCGKEDERAGKYCTECGGETEIIYVVKPDKKIICYYCEKELLHNDKYCPYCGKETNISHSINNFEKECGYPLWSIHVREKLHKQYDDSEGIKDVSVDLKKYQKQDSQPPFEYTISCIGTETFQYLTHSTPGYGGSDNYYDDRYDQAVYVFGIKIINDQECFFFLRREEEK